MGASLQFSYFAWLKPIQLFEEGSIWIFCRSNLVPKQFQKNQMKKINKPNYKLKSISISSPNSLFDPTDKQESQESTFQQM
jgi:hypothetical protein